MQSLVDSKYVKKKKIEKKLETKGGQHNGISLNLLFCYYISTILLIVIIWKSNLNTIKSTLTSKKLVTSKK